MKIKNEIFNIYITALTLLAVIVNTSNAADDLSGKFFSDSSPILAGNYINDFLPWVSWLFYFIGLLMANLIHKFLTGKKLYISIGILWIFGIFSLFYSMNSNQQKFEIEIWRDLNRVTEVWWNSWSYGIFCVVWVEWINYAYKKFSNSPIL